MEFYIPTETGEFLAFCAALATAAIGLIFLFAPGVAFRALGLLPRDITVSDAQRKPGS